ncbi:MAG: hypothetical protein K5898_09170 [Ruminococcus sp.]|uniref:hypothetical protein n=1 Tax=Ruminococcus sp. TaxID=41978 RepID=UPI0025DC0B32|nr:hypothetical protein [Ruminococcus sp.]MCR4795322.1 hypothetical protein [Ruminococcus sp.]
MKKIFSFIGVIITSLILCIFPYIQVSAEGAEVSPFYMTFSQWRSNRNYSSDRMEFLAYHHFHRDATNKDYYVTFGFSLSSSDYESKVSSVSLDNNIIIVDIDDRNVSFSSDYVVTSPSGDYVYSNEIKGYSFDVYKFEYNISTNEIKFYNESKNSFISVFDGIGDDSTTIVCDDFVTNFVEISSGSDIEVEVFPELTDNFNYSASATIAGEEYNMEVTSIQVDIINNTGNNYQYAILIQPKNATLSYGLPPNTENPTMFWGNSSVIYALIKDEWVQSPLSFSLDNFIGSTEFNQGAVTINTPSAWHFVGHHSSTREQIYYNQMQLKKGVDYTFKVIGYNITQFSPTEFTDDLPISFSSEFLIANLSLNGEVLYEKNFSVSKDTEYNPDSIANGAYSFDNTSSAGSQFDKIKGFQDSDGTVKILGDKSLNSSNTRIGSNASFNSLISNSTSFLSLMKNVLFYMPDWLSVLLFGGMLAIVLAAIWHKF